MNFLRSIVLILIIQLPAQGISQFSFHNFGNIKMHEEARIGFHENLINDGAFDENLGLTGFYNNDTAFIAGAFRPIFNDIEIVVPNNLRLDVGMGVTNNGNFILGDVLTPRNLPDVNLEFVDMGFYTGDSDATKVDGYSAVNNKQRFVFPVGDSGRLRPLTLESEAINNIAKSAYFRENPNSPSTFPISFDTEIRTDILLTISNEEFWDLDTDVPSEVTLTWDINSNLSGFIDELQNLRIVGWNTQNAIWEDLGNTNLTGDFDSGEITSDVFVPNNYSVITFGGSLSKSSITLGDYLLTPNGDGVNDFLELQAVAISPNNRLKIFNRWGRAVYVEDNYHNSFDGKANVKNVVNSKKKLPAGVYFYIIELFDIDFVHQGYMYIDQ